MNNTLSIIAIITFVPSVLAQTTGQIANYGSTGLSNTNAVSQVNALLGPIAEANKKRVLELENIQGSPYLSNLFLPTQLYYKDELQGDIFYRYNAYNEEIEVKDQNLDNETIRGLSRDKNISIRVGGNPMGFKTFIDKKGLTQNGYLTLLIDDKYKFYKRIDVKYTEGQKAQNSFVKAVPPRFSKFTEYYLLVPGKNRVDELELSNRKFIKLLPSDIQQVVKDYLKENNIKIKDENSVSLVLKWLVQQ